MIKYYGGGTGEIGRGCGNDETGQRAHASWPISSAGANLMVDRRPLSYPVNANVRVLLVKVENPEAFITSGKLIRRSRHFKLRTAINDVMSLVVVVPIATMMCA